MSELTQEALKKLLHYDPDTGAMTWLVTAGRVKIGDKVGSVKRLNRKEYIHTKIKGRRYLIHRLAWLYVYGEFPMNDIDHIDGDGRNNELVNLRAVTRAENCKNVRKAKNNTSGVTGVIWHARDETWEAFIRVNNKRMYLGRYLSIFDAACVRKNAERTYGYHPNHGKRREGT